MDKNAVPTFCAAGLEVHPNTLVRQDCIVEKHVLRPVGFNICGRGPPVVSIHIAHLVSQAMQEAEDS